MDGAEMIRGERVRVWHGCRWWDGRFVRESHRTDWWWVEIPEAGKETSIFLIDSDRVEAR